MHILNENAQNCEYKYNFLLEENIQLKKAILFLENKIEI